LSTVREWTPPHRTSLADQAAEALLTGIRGGIWRGELPGERVLCEQLSVSRPTLRAALAELEGAGVLLAKRGKRRRIVVGGKAPARHSAVRSVGLLSPIPMESMPPFALNWIDRLRTRLAQDRLTLEMHVAPRCYGRTPSGTLSAWMARTPARAWILFHSTPAMQKWFQERRVPCVLAGSPFPGIHLSSIDVDYRAACRHAGGVLRRRGIERVCLLLPEGAHGGDSESIAGLSERYAADAIHLVHHDGSPRAIVASVDAVLAARPQTKAFVVARSAPVLAVITRLLERGCRLPDDVAVISRDDDAHLEFLTPRVTRYRTSPHAFARRLGDVCLRLAHGKRTPARGLKLLPKFVPGETA
jgi:DNA-binding LacI/PurR family transcriptional regulator